MQPPPAPEPADLPNDTQTRTTILARLACANDPNTVTVANAEVAAQSQARLMAKLTGK